MTAAVLIAVVVLIAAAIRIAGINCQLWLDEIWSIRLAQKAGSPLGVFFISHDNNHWLNTLLLYFIGPGRAFWTYHVFPEICGIGTVALGGLLARPNGSRQTFCALVLLGASEFLVEYSTEARGYAPAGFFTLLCLWLLQIHLMRPRRLTAVLMSMSAVLGLLSHLTFVVILAGLAATSIAALHRRLSWSGVILHAAMWWAVPLVILAALYFVDVRGMTRGGGPPTPDDLPSQAAAMVLGIPVGSVVAPVMGIVAMVICGVQIVRLVRAGCPAAWFFVAALLLVPALLFFWPRTTYLHPRYVYVAVPVMFVLIGIELGSWLSGRLPARFVAAALLAGFCVVNGRLISNFLHLGRGDYRGALAFLMSHTDGRDIVVGADRHPVSTLMVLEYYGNGVLDNRRLLTLNGEEWGDQWPQWIVAEEDLGPYINTTDGAPFVRQANFPNGAVTSGIPWTIYEAQTGRPNVRQENLRTLSTNGQSE